MTENSKMNIDRPKNIDTDVLDYFPLQEGFVPASSVKMKRLSKLPLARQKLFQIDKWSDIALLEKSVTKVNFPGKHYGRLEHGPYSRSNLDLSPLFVFIINHLVNDYPNHFHCKGNVSKKQMGLYCRLTRQIIVFNVDNGRLIYDHHFEPDSEALGGNLFCSKHRVVGDPFKLLAMQVPEDLVFYARKPNDETDIGQVSHAHLMSAADWSAEWAVGKTLAELHANVVNTDGSSVIKNNLGMVRGIMKMPESVERVGAISFRTTYKQNLHPDVDPGYSWTFDDDQELYIRFERQTVTPIPLANGFLFTIKPYYANLLDPKRIKQAIKALKNIDENSYYRNLLQERGDDIIKFLEEKKVKYETMGIL